MKLLVTGGRNWHNFRMFDDAIRALDNRPSMIITGGYTGTDKVAIDWAKQNSVHYVTVPALWDQYGDCAEPLRNSMMLLLKPDLCLAMPGGRGTEDMISKCLADGITVMQATYQ